MSDLINPQEMDALLKAVEGGAAAPDAAAVPVRLYDFKRPERVSKEQIRALANLHEVFARSFGASLSGMMRTVCEMRLGTLSQMTYQEYVSALPNPTCFTLFSCEPLSGNMMIEFNPSVMFPIIDRLLGGGKAGPAVPNRPLTNIEWALAGAIAKRALEDLSAMWTAVRKLDLRVVSSESNPLLIQAVPPNELVVVAAFDVRIGDSDGHINLCIPYVTIEPLVGDIESHSWYPTSAPPSSRAPAIPGSLAQATLGVTAVLAETSITLRELLALEPGDLIETRQPAAGAVVLMLEGKRKFAGRPAAWRNHYAVEIMGHEGDRP